MAAVVCVMTQRHGVPEAAEAEPLRRQQQHVGADLRGGEPGRLLSRHQRHPGAPLQRQPRLRVAEGRNEEPRDSGGPREAVHLRVPGHPAGRQPGPEVRAAPDRYGVYIH